MFSLPIPPTKEKEKEKENDKSNVGELMMDLAEDKPEDRAGTTTPDNTTAEKTTITTEKQVMPTSVNEAATNSAKTATPNSVEKEAGKIPPNSAEKEASTTPPTPAEKEVGTTPEKSTDPKQKGTQKPDWPSTPSSKGSSSDNDTNNEE